MNDPEDRTRMQASFFQGSNGISTNAGQFMNAGGNITLNTFHYNRAGHTDSRENVIPNGSLQGTANALDPRGPSSGEDRSTSPSGPSLPVINTLDIYGRHLATKRRGYPLWIPEPDTQLTLQYQREGLSVGDVGVITSSGSFDFMFNILLPSDHPINVDEVPDNFRPLKPPLKRTDIRGRRELKSDSFLASASVVRSPRGAETGSHQGLAFEATTSEGAILAIPNGALSRDLKSLNGFRDYMHANLLSWYKHFNGVRRWGLKNGDIRLVVGTDKASGWGMAVFSSLTNQEEEFYLNFRPTSRWQMQRGAMYDWEYSGTAEVRAGPDASDLAALRTDESQVYENQCLFVRTLNATVRDDIWKTLESDTGFNTQALDGSTNSSTQFFDSFLPPATFFDSLNTSNQVWGPPPDSRNRKNLPDSVAQAVHRASLTLIQVHHPSKLLNERLLLEHPDAEMVITADNDWISAITDEDHLIPCNAELVSRILSKYCVRRKRGLLFLDSVSAQHDRHSLESSTTTSTRAPLDEPGMFIGMARRKRAMVEPLATHRHSISASSMTGRTTKMGVREVSVVNRAGDGDVYTRPSSGLNTMTNTPGGSCYKAPDASTAVRGPKGSGKGKGKNKSSGIPGSMSDEIDEIQLLPTVSEFSRLYGGEANRSPLEQISTHPFSAHQQLDSQSRKAIPPALGYPCNPAPTFSPLLPLTTRRIMLKDEMSDSLRRNLLWERERQAAKADLEKDRGYSTGSSAAAGNERRNERTHEGGRVQSLMAGPGMAQPQPARAKLNSEEQQQQQQRTIDVSKILVDEVDKRKNSKKQFSFLSEPLTPSQKNPTQSWNEDPDEALKSKLEDWKAVPLSEATGPRLPSQSVKPLKSAMKKPPVRPPDYSREKNAYTDGAHYSKGETGKEKEYKYYPARVSQRPSKAYLEMLEEEKSAVQ